MRRLLILLRWLVFSLLLLLVLTAGSLYWLVATNQGNAVLVRLALAQSDRLPVQLKIGTVAGNLHDGLLLKNLFVQTDDLTLELQQLLLSVNLQQLLQRELHIHALVVDGLVVNYLSPDKPKDKTTDPFVLPINIQLDELLLRNALIRVDDNALDVALASMRGRAGVTNPVTAPKMQYQLSIDTLEGTVNALAFSGRGSFLLDGERLAFDALQLRVADNRLLLEGSVDSTTQQLDFDLELPKLEQLLPQAQGQFFAQGQIGGTRTHPSLLISADVEGLAYADYALGRLVLDAQLIAEEDDNLAVRLTAEQLGAPGLHLDSLGFTVTGQLHAHHAELHVHADALPITDLRMVLAGGYTDESWTGELSELTLLSTALGTFALANPTALGLSATRIALDELCLRNAAQEGLCLAGSVAQERLDLRGRLEDLAVNSLLQFSAPDWRASGTLNADFALSGTTANPVFKLHLQPMQGAIDLSDQDIAISSLPYRVEQATLDWQGQSGVLQLAINLEQYGRINAEANVQDAQLQGLVQLRMDSIVWLERFVPLYARQIDGRLNMDAEISGQLDAPLVAVSGTLSDGRFVSPQAGISVDVLELAMLPGDNAVLITGSARSGEGSLRLQGNLDLQTQALRLSLEGERFTAVRRPEAEILISPKLRYQQEAGVRSMTGSILIPEARIRLRKPPEGAVSPSEDEQIAGRTTTVAEPVTPFDVDIDILLGDAIHLTAFGLDARLAGALKLAQQERNLAATGRIDLQEGTFAAYGQNLTIDTGTLIFTGNLTNPMLDIEAYRDSTDKRVRITVNATGSALQPQLRIASNPDMPESEALAYLLTGRGLGSADSAQGSAISNAALQYGIADPLLGEMRGRLGLDEFGLTSDAGGSAFGLGKQITPDIFLGYSVGLFDNLSQLILRWRLTDKLELDSRSGEQQSVDLYYRIERD